MMVDELTPEEKWEPLLRREEAAPTETIDIQENIQEDLQQDLPEEEGNSFPLELTQDSQEHYTEEQRQNLHRKISDMGTSEKLRLAPLANREARNLLIHDPNKMISLAVLKNQRMTDGEVLHYAKKRDLPDEVIMAIAKDQKWKKNYPIKLALVSNPKTPLSAAINFLSHLQERDLKFLTKDNDVPSALRRRAQETLEKKRH